MASSSSNEVQPPHLVPSANNVGAQAPMLIMRPELLMAARSGNLMLLRDLLNGEDELALPAYAATMVVVDVHEASLLIRRPSTDVSLEGASHLSASRPPSPQPSPVTTVLPGATSQGGSVLHVVAACGDSQEFLQCAQLIYDKANHLLQDRCNKNGDTPLHCAARAGNVAMASLLISLAGGGQDTNDDSDARALLRKQNKNGETVLHDSIRFAREGMVELLMSADPELARVPDVGTSPLYLAISLGRDGIAQLLHERDGGLSYSGPDGQTALHAAVLRDKGMTEMLLGWNKDLAKEVDRFGNTPLHFAASVECSGRETVLGSSFWFSFSRRMYGMTELLLDADISSVYHPDKDGLFPIHVAASMGRLNIVKILLDKCPDCAGLLDVQGRTFLHVAVENKRHNIVAFACKEPRLASVLNMQDDDMNTALHLAVQVGDLHSFGYLIRNKQVFLDLANNKGHTALDVSESVVNHSGLHYGSNAQSWIHRLLACTTMGGTSCRQDRFQEIYVPKLDQVEESRKMTESTQYLGISSVLIVTITFAAAFAPPGGYRADDHTNGGAPTLAGSYAFNAFVISNTMAFISSSLSTFGLMYSGMTAVDFSIRKKYFTVSLILLRSSVRSMGVAFASGIYVALAPVALVTAITVCCITSAPVLYGNRQNSRSSGMSTPGNSSSQAGPNSILAPNTAEQLSSQGTESEPIAVDEEVDAEPAHAGSKRKLRSAVWNEFKLIKIGGDWKAECMWCKYKLVGESKHGTSHLSSHLKTCAARHAPIGPKQSKLRLTSSEDGKVNFENYVFDQEVARKELALMICVHEYPLTMVDHIGFRRFCSALQPMYKVVSRNTIRKDILDMYEVQKNMMVKYFANFSNRVAITTDMWTAGYQKRGYMAVTGHFIDASWNLKSILLRFIYVPTPHTGAVICDALYECLVDWLLERKISTLTLDNCSTNDSLVGLLKDKLDKNSLMSQGSYLHMRCCAHILNLIVKDGLDILEKRIERIRDSVAFWSATPKRHERFDKMCRLMNVECTRRLSLDCKTRWNSTYIMLSIAIQYKDVFDRLALRETGFTCPEIEDWVFAKEVCDRLKMFYDLTELFSGTRYVTANLFFPKICGIRLAIRKWQSSNIQIIEEMSEAMMQKFEKYWNDVHGLMAVATALDPRYKLHMLQALFGSLYGVEHAHFEVTKIRKLMYELLVEYQDAPEGVGTSQVSNSAAQNQCQDEVFDIFDQYMSSQPALCTSNVHTELDLYLDEPPLPRTQELDIINWWKFGGIKYPTLQKIAHDILAIPITTVASESAFSTSGRIISPHRS